MDISSISSQLNLSIPELRKRAQDAGFKISPRANKIDNYLAKQILEKLKVENKHTQEKVVSPETKNVTLPSFVKVKDFAVLLNLPVTQVIKVLIQNGVMATINEEIDHDTASIVAQDLGYNVAANAETENDTYGIAYLHNVLENEDKDKLKARPPIVAVMGHVDHGKTTLLDAIRKTSVVSSESGGITQHIGAYQVKHDGKLITFLDTPGHEAFVEMRARGANVTDIIILVVAADDGVRPQTIEVINRAKFSNTPIIVAINKVDKPTANVTRVKQELAEHGLLTEDWGGKVIAVEVSAKNNTGITDLLGVIQLSAELENYQANPNREAVGTVIESKVTQGQGSVATVIIQHGTLKVGDIFACGTAHGKIKSLEDEYNNKVKAAPPSTPVRISGFSQLPEVGDILQVTTTLDEAKSISMAAQKKKHARHIQNKTSVIGDTETKTLNIVLKADVTGSLEAIKQSLAKLKNDEVKLNILSEGIGEVNESDILMASNSKGSAIVAFRVKTNPKAINLAKQKSVVIDSYEVIYELLEDITSAMVKLFTPELEKVSFGKGKILGIFRTEKNQVIFGGRVEEGELRKEKLVCFWRGENMIGTGEILELQQNKLTTKSVLIGEEFGMKVKTNAKINLHDVVESFEENIKQKSLIK